MAESLAAYARRRKAWTEHVRNFKAPGHEVHAEMDWAKAFASRPGSADWKAFCACGWESSGWHYGEGEALASAYRHVRSVEREIAANPNVAPDTPPPDFSEEG